MKLEFKIAKLICETKNKNKLIEIFGTDDTEEILEQGIDEIIASIETEYDVRPRRLCYGEIVIISTSSKPAVFISENSSGQAHVLTSSGYMTVSIENISPTGRILWLDELDQRYENSAIPITENTRPNINIVEKLEQLLSNK